MDCISHREAIAALGGKSALARAIGVDPKLATHWPARGIPAKHWHDVAEVAAKAKKPHITVSALKGTKPSFARPEPIAAPVAA